MAGLHAACSVLLPLMTLAEHCLAYAVRLDEAETLKYQDAGKQKAKEAKDFSAMRSEVLEMQQICEQLQSPVVFAHNDLLSGNIMIPLDVSWLLHLHGMRICYILCSCCLHIPLLIMGAWAHTWTSPHGISQH